MPTDLKAVAVIPVRWNSSRFPGKPLEKIRGRPMIEWVVERAFKARRIEDVIVATDEEQILNTVISFGGKAVMTSRDHVSGTDRIAEAIRDCHCSIVVNIQGDEPLIPPENIDLVVEPFLTDESLNVSTLKIRLKENQDILNTNVTKVVTNSEGFALYFSRAPIPFNRDDWGNLFEKGCEGNVDLESMEVYKHIGVYGFSKSFLIEFTKLPRSRLEKWERLEQLRILDQGIPIRVVETQSDSIGVDCREDLIKVKQLLNDNQS